MFAWWVSGTFGAGGFWVVFSFGWFIGDHCSRLLGWFPAYGRIRGIRCVCGVGGVFGMGGVGCIGCVRGAAPEACLSENLSISVLQMFVHEVMKRDK